MSLSRIGSIVYGFPFIRKAVVVVLLFIQMYVSCAAAQDFSYSRRTRVNEETMQLCGDLQLGLKFLCDPNWIAFNDGNSLLIIVSAEPLVAITISKTQHALRFLEQINLTHLHDLGSYAKGFVTEGVSVAERPAIKVKSFSRDDPEVRLTDYYFLNNESLYSVSFVVSPKSRWDDYKFLIKDVAGSLRFFTYAEILQVTQGNAEGVSVLKWY